MILQALTVTNYKSFLQTQTAKIEPGFNLFIGTNNSGKTSMLETLDFNLGTNVPHRSIQNLTQYGDQAMGHSELSVTIRTNLLEMREPTTNRIILPLPKDYISQLPHNVSPAAFISAMLIERPEVDITFTNGGGSTSIAFVGPLNGTISISNTNNEGGNAFSGIITDKPAAFSNPNITGIGRGYSASFAEMADRYKKFFYRFSALRRPAGVSGPTAHPVVLDRDAGNLPYCLNTFQSTDSHGYSILCDWIRRVFPSVAWVQSSPIPTNQFEIFCLPESPSARRDDLAVPLNLMGTGIGNVIAILYIVLTSRFPQVIAIDEPNSFLHPRALRELLQILAVEGKQHQYILTAHSADVITALDPSLITIFNFDGAVTSIRQIPSHEIFSIRADLSDLGIRMTDLHGRDRVLWVEGQTEELVIPDLLRQYCQETASGTAVLRVEHTGTFEKRKGISPTEVVKLYQRLSHSSALVPPMVAILLDRENRDERECSKLTKESNGALRFLDRPMLEDYVLSPDAVSATLNALGEDCTIEQVKVELDQRLTARMTSKKTAAVILEEIFSTLSEARHEFKKTRDVPALIAWLLENNQSFLDPLGSFMQTLFKPVAEAA